MILQLYGSFLTSCIYIGPTLGGKCVFTLITSRSYNSLGTLPRDFHRMSTDRLIWGGSQHAWFTSYFRSGFSKRLNFWKICSLAAPPPPQHISKVSLTPNLYVKELTKTWNNTSKILDLCCRRITDIECLLHTRHYSKCFTFITSIL